MPFNKRAEGDFIVAARSEAVTEGQMTAVKVAGRRVILTRHNGRLYAIDSSCPHAAADLAKGSLRSWQLCCHEHDYCFDIRSGRLVWPEDEPYRLRRYETREEGGQVKVRLAALS
jgi:nitrite reductase/ring-hydroxylating ferredoxin subunit